MTEEKKQDKKEEKAVVETANLETQNQAAASDDKIGSILKQARLAQGKKIPEISQTLCIRKAYLEAIENNDYENIPAFPYGIGFIRSYADYLGLNSSLIIQKYKEETEVAPDSEGSYYVPEPQAEATVPNKKYLLISLLALIAVYFAWLFYNNSKQVETEDMASNFEKVADTEDTTADINQYPLVVEDYAPVETESDVKLGGETLPVIETAPVDAVENSQVTVNEGSFNENAAESNKPVDSASVKPVAAPVVDAVKEPAKEAASGKSNIVLKVKKETWIEVKNADKLFISKVLYAGDSYAIPKGKGMILSVGRVDGVDVLMDGKPVNVIPSDRKTNISLDEALSKLEH